jgi:hypothetical protein
MLRAACDDRLGEIVWFRADWQLGGAATGNASWRRDDGTECQSVVKIPVGRREVTWTRRLQNGLVDDGVVPRLYAWGETIEGYDLAWIVIERFEHGPLGMHWHEHHIERIADAAARFHAAASAYEIDEPPRSEPWEALVEDAQRSIRTNRLPEQDRWIKAVKALRGRLHATAGEWSARPITDWLHGDLHVANAMSRHSLEHGAVSLIDLAEVRPGHWIEDAIYLERQCWARPERLEPLRPVRAVAEARRRLGLPVGDGYQRLATIRRALLAATAPRFLRTEGHPRHLAACLEWLERSLSEL